MKDPLQLQPIFAAHYRAVLPSHTILDSDPNVITTTHIQIIDSIFNNPFIVTCHWSSRESENTMFLALAAADCITNCSLCPTVPLQYHKISAAGKVI